MAMSDMFTTDPVTAPLSTAITPEEQSIHCFAGRFQSLFRQACNEHQQSSAALATNVVARREVLDVLT